jgi:hypothetical protein
MVDFKNLVAEFENQKDGLDSDGLSFVNGTAQAIAYERMIES